MHTLTMCAHNTAYATTCMYIYHMAPKHMCTQMFHTATHCIEDMILTKYSLNTMQHSTYPLLLYTYSPTHDRLHAQYACAHTTTSSHRQHIAQEFINTLIHSHIHLQSYTLKCTHSFINTLMHTYTQMHMNSHTLICTHTLPCSLTLIFTLMQTLTNKLRIHTQSLRV